MKYETGLLSLTVHNLVGRRCQEVLWGECPLAACGPPRVEWEAEWGARAE